MNREERRKLSKNAIQEVRTEGIQNVSVSILEVSLCGIGNQIQVQGVINHDMNIIQGMSSSCIHAGSIYELIRSELIRRISTLSSTEGITDESDECTTKLDYASINWDEASRKSFRKAYLDKWRRNPTDVNAMLYTLACMPLPVWHWRMYKYYTNNFIPPLSERLHYIALKTAGVKGYDCCHQGLDFLEFEVSKRAKAPNYFPTFPDNIDPWSDDSDYIEAEDAGMRLWKEAFRWEK